MTGTGRHSQARAPGLAGTASAYKPDMKTRFVAALLVLAILSAGCQRESVSTTTADPSTSAAATSGTDVPATDASTVAVDVKIPLMVNAVSKCEPSTTTFAQDEPIVLTLELNESPEGLVVLARIIGDDGEPVAIAREEAKGRKSIVLTIRDEVPAGVYKLEGLWGGNVVCEHAIEIEG